MVNKADLRQFIVQYFTDTELDALCFDYFPDVLSDFTEGMTKSQKVIALISFADSRDLTDHLLAALHQTRPERYQERFGLPPAAARSEGEERRADRVFLSHAHQDTAIARRLADDLRQQGFDVWIAPDSIRPGEKWVDAINHGLETSGVFLLVMSPHAAASRWVRDESGYAIELENKGEIRFISVQVGEGRIPPLWSVRQHISFRSSYEDGFRQLMAALHPSGDRPPVVTHEDPGRDDTSEAAESDHAPAKSSVNSASTPVSRSVGRPTLSRPQLFGALGVVTVVALVLLAWRFLGNEDGGPPGDSEPSPGQVEIVELPGGLEKETVYVPAGSFAMGLPSGEHDELPVHDVTLDAFWLDRTEVTNAQFEAFVNDTEYVTLGEEEGGGYTFVQGEWGYIAGADWRHPFGPGSNLQDQADHPVVIVSWNDAAAFCEWAGGRLPTEAEWEYAARGEDGWLWPWGDTYDAENLNQCDRNCPDEPRDELEDDGYPFASPTGAFPTGASWVQALDMAGNVWEWVGDWYGSVYYASSPVENPAGPESGSQRVVRGGSWANWGAEVTMADRVAYDPGDHDANLGFRCAHDVD